MSLALHWFRSDLRTHDNRALAAAQAAIHEPKIERPADYPPAVIDLAFGRERVLNAFKPK